MDTFQKQHILIVDDDKQIARLLRQYLEKAGYGVLLAVFIFSPLTPQSS